MHCDKLKGFQPELCFKEKHHCFLFCILPSANRNLNASGSLLNTMSIKKNYFDLLFLCSHFWAKCLAFNQLVFSAVKVIQERRRVGFFTSNYPHLKMFLYWKNFGTFQLLGHSFAQQNTKMMCFWNQYPEVISLEKSGWKEFKYTRKDGQ